MSKKLKLGIIGLSQGNGHPYSWSAIFNGYNPSDMKDCGFPVIPEYLSKQTFPNDCIKDAEVTHIWTQDKKLSQHVALASNIPHVCDNMEELLNNVDAILLARDDAENHFEMARIFIEAGLPIYIDKPLAFSLAEAEKIYKLEKYPQQIFTCSALAYAPELQLPFDIGTILHIESVIIKDWNKYAIHIIEPTLKFLPPHSQILQSTVNNFSNNKTLILNWDSGVTTTFLTIKQGKFKAKIFLYGTKGYHEIQFNSTFNSFKNALQHFVNIITKKEQNTSKETALQAISIIERGNES